MTNACNALLATTLMAAGLAGPAAAAGLDGYLWKARPVLVFAPTREAAALQLGRLRDAAPELAERRMPVLLVAAKAVSEESRAAGRSNLDAAELRRIYRIPAQAFAIILVGMDGGEKLRSKTPVEAERLTGLVDEMPMRRNEAR